MKKIRNIFSGDDSPKDECVHIIIKAPELVVAAELSLTIDSKLDKLIKMMGNDRLEIKLSRATTDAYHRLLDKFDLRTIKTKPEIGLVNKNTPKFQWDPLKTEVSGVGLVFVVFWIT